MIIWKEFRTRILAVTFISAALIAGKVIFIPTPYKPKATAFNFPQSVPLSQWQLSKTELLPKPKYLIPELVTQWRYQYTQKSQNLPLDIQMYYVSGLTDASEKMQYINKILSPPKLYKREGIGYYGLGVNEKRAFLVACINPRGNTTITAMQSLKNGFSYDVRPNRLMVALLGQAPLLDKRCLFTYMSVPLENTSEGIAYQVLENAFFEWHKWWYTNYPAEN
jgi:cyanosortase A-associated protein